MSRLMRVREAEIRRAEADGGRPYERSLLDEIDALRAELADENSEVKRLEQIVLRQRAELAEAKALAALGKMAVDYVESGDCLMCDRTALFGDDAHCSTHDEDCPVGEYVKEHPQ